MPEDDRRFALDIGLLRRSPLGGLEVANPIYREIIVRSLAGGASDSLPRIPTTWLSPAGKLDKAALLQSFLEGADGRRFALAELKLQCVRTFQRFDRQGRAERLALADEFSSADGIVHPKEAAFRAELSALLDAPLLPDEARPRRRGRSW